MQLERLDAGKLNGDTSPLVSWIFDAWTPYRTWLLGEDARAVRVIREWLGRENSELSIVGITALVDAGKHVGGYLAVSGHDLPRRRKADLLWLLQNSDQEERRELTARLHASRGLFAPVEPRQLYLSKIGVLPEHRAKGLGGVLLDDFIRVGFEQTYDALRLDVWADNEPAVRLYRARGFETIAEATLAPLGIRYFGMTLSRSDA